MAKRLAISTQSSRNAAIHAKKPHHQETNLDVVQMVMATASLEHGRVSISP
jgi:hypothetical protein